MSTDSRNYAIEDLDAGLPPSCVDACPMHALDFGEHTQLEEKYGSLEDIYPLPETYFTKPTLVVTPHQNTVKPGNGSAEVGYWEEVERGEIKNRSLVAFTLFFQMAVGASWILGTLHLWATCHVGKANALIDRTSGVVVLVSESDPTIRLRRPYVWRLVTPPRNAIP